MILLFTLLLATKIILLCFFILFCVVYNSFFTISLLIESTKLEFAFVIPIGSPITLAIESIKTSPPVAYKTYKILSK